MATIKNFEIIERLNTNPEIQIFRALDTVSQKKVIVKNIPHTNEFNPSVVNLKNEFEIMKYLSDSPFMLSVNSFERHETGYMLIMEDTEGISLKELHLKKTFSLENFFKIAISLSELILHIHKKKIIHKDIKPDNIILSQELKDIRIIDFGISTRLSKEETKWIAPNVLEGSVYYISPEQTGRMNRAVDYRSDFYSLGITFYELLTGKLPFVSTDLLEVVHSHLAKTPITVHTLKPEYPIILSKIIEKMMSKTAENRYQTAFGLKHDLEKAYNLYTEAKSQSANISSIDFPPGEMDISDEFTIQQKLYGREGDIAKLIESFDLVQSTGSSEIILIGGYSGVGKSSLVKEISKPITESRGYFLSGKYDQYNKNMPFSALIQVFTSMIRLILTESPDDIQRWKEEFQVALGSNGKILTDVIPELEYVIGKQTDVVELGAQENANRFYLVFQNFIKVLSNESHPLAIFLDDLQWADSASLILIQSLIEDKTVKYLYLMLAYRNNEVDNSHPFRLLINTISKTGYTIEEIILKPLTEENVKQLLVESLYSKPEDVSELASLVFNKTGGNPFFINEFLKTLSREDFIYFDYDRAVWKWKIQEINNLKISDNVVELLIQKILKLSPSTREILKLASCIGNKFDLYTLSMIYKKGLKETATSIMEVVQAEMIYPIGDNYKLVDSMSGTNESAISNIKTAKSIQFKFQHDRVQQASYEMLDVELKNQLRLEIAQILYKSTEPSKLEENLFDIVNHFNIGIDFIKEPNDLKLLVNLNLQAGKKAKISTAYKPSLEYLNMASTILTKWLGKEQSIIKAYDLSLNIFKELAEVEYLNGNFENSESIIQNILNHSRDTLEKGEAYNLLIIQYCSLGKYDKALEIIKLALNLLGDMIPSDDFSTALQKELADLKDNLGDRKVSELLKASQMTDPTKILIIKILTNSLPMAYNLLPQLFPIISAKMVNLFLRYGVLAESYGFACYSIVLATGFSDYKNAYDYSFLAVKLSEKYKSQAEKAKGSNVLANYATPFVNHLKEAEKINREGLQACYDSGEFLHGSYSAMNMCLNSFYQGEPLEKVINEKVETLYHFATKVKSSLSIDTIMAVKIIANNLIGNTTSSHSFDLDENSEEEYYKNCRDHQSMFPICLYKIMKAQVNYYYGDYDSALKEIREAKELLPFISGQNSNAEHNFYESLILCSLYKNVDKVTKQEYAKQIHLNQKQMKTWAESCPENFLHKYLLVEAEIAAIEYKNWKAGKLYDEAITEARKNDFIQNEALANELAGKFWYKKKNFRSAQSYLLSAYQRYESWGAIHKNKRLKLQYTDLISGSKIGFDSSTLSITNPTLNTTMTAGANTLLHGGNSLDFQSIMKSSAAISGEIRLESLLQKIMNIVIENAGAQRGVLLLKSKHDFYIEAEGSTNDSDVKVRTNIALKDFHDIPHSLIYYVERTKDHSVIHDAVHDEKFNKDEYIQRKQIKSILCSPILKQGVLSGILYIENNLTTGAFTEDRLQVIKVLATQAAISIDNALLYANLEERVMERTRELKTANEELAEKNKHITDSIHYAKTIQEAILPSPASIGKRYDDFFIGFYPKDIVSGDFFWYTETPESTFIAAVDCTGHGVPGAFMSMIGTALLNQIVKELKITDPAGILSQLNKSVRIALKQDLSDDASRDGMEICLCRIDPHRVVFSGGHRPLFLVKNGEFHTYRGDKESIGGKQKHEERNFTNTEISIDPNAHTAIYLTTDGFQDQPNPEGKKIGSRGLHEMILKYHLLSGKDQAHKLEEELKAHSRTEAQRDDITIIGIIFQKR
jgi:predicted ATPase/GAF domain-containing protein